MKQKSSPKSTFKDSDFAGVDPHKRQALVVALNTLSEQARRAGQALDDATPGEAILGEVPVPDLAQSGDDLTSPRESIG